MKLYSWSLLPLLTAKIENYQKESAHKDMAKLLEIIGSDSKRNLTLRKLRCAQIISACLRAAHRGGVASEPLLTNHFDILERIAGIRSWITLKKLMHIYLEDLFTLVRKIRRTSIERAVARICDDMEKNLEHPKTLAHYADVLGVSKGHLSRYFSAIVGHPFREELRRLRRELACELLRNTNMKIHAVSTRIGLADPSQFITQFRKDLGITPAVYREKYQ